MSRKLYTDTDKYAWQSEFALVEAYNSAGIKRITVVRGYRAEAVDLPSLTYVDNADYADTSEIHSLAAALAADPEIGRAHV